MKYLELKQKIENEVNALPLGFAFGKEQFAQMMAKWGLTVDDTDKIFAIGGGGYAQKKDREMILSTFKRHNEEHDRCMLEDDEYLYDAVRYELGNHEYCITGNFTDTFRCLGITMDEYRSNARVTRIVNKARKDYMSWCEEHDCF